MPPKKKAANGYQLAEPLPKGEVLGDICKKKWKLGVSIGKGGFGEIYGAQEAGSSASKFPYVIKIEPHANGPLFVERNFYINYAKPEDVATFKQERGLKTLGMPVYIGSGTHEYNKQKYRFLVMEKFGTDLWKLFLLNNKVFPVDTVFKIAIQILDVLEYIHSKGYVHADIKGANILMGTSKETQDKQVYLVDFGLACKFSTDKEFKPNLKKAHDGTIEYLSRDAHCGVQTRRGDLEILAYNIIHWLGCELPWEGHLADPKVVQASKVEHMGSLPKMIKACFKSKTPPSAVVSFLKYLKTLNCDTEPDYKKIRSIFTAGVKEAGGSIGSLLRFSSSKRRSLSENDMPAKNEGKKQRMLRNVKNINYKDPSTSDGDGLTPVKNKIKKIVRKGTKKVVTKKSQSKKEEQSDQSEIEGDEDSEPEQVNRNFITNRRNGNQRDRVKPDKSMDSRTESDEEAYTEAMKEVMSKMQNGHRRVKPVKKNPVSVASISDSEDNMEGYTEEMRQLAAKKKQRTESKSKKPQKRTKKSGDLLPVATGSKASDKRGLVKVTSRRLNKDDAPLTHGNVVSASESESE